MHLTRTQVSRNIPISRKGTKYVARASSHVKEGVPVVVAIRDMLKLAKTSKEVKSMIRRKLIKINGRLVKDHRESIRLFNILLANKTYKLLILPTGRFEFKESKDDLRLCKIIGKTILKNKKVQINLHDGTNILTKEKTRVGDSVELDTHNKIKKHFPLEKGKTIFILSGRNIGLTGKVKEIEGNKAKIKLDKVDREVELDKVHVIVSE